MRQPILIDGRRIYNPEEFTQKLKFAAIGLGPRKPDATPDRPQERQQDKQ
jgi:hypothetical protein